MLKAIATITNSSTIPNEIIVNSTTPALTINQTGTGNALLVEDSASPDASPFVVDASGRVVVGDTQIRTGVYSAIPSFSVSGTSLNTSTAAFYDWANNSFTGPNFLTQKSKSGTAGTQGIVASGDRLFLGSFSGSDGVAFIPAATIESFVDGTPGTNDMPGRLVFSTTADGASSPTERMRIDSAGQITIGGTAAAGRNLNLLKTITGSTNSNGFTQSGVVQSDVTSIARGYRNVASTAAAAFTLGEYSHFFADQGTIGATSSITNQYCFHAATSVVGATNNYGFYGNIAAGANRYNFYANGTAANVFAGTTSIGGLVGAESLRVTPVASAVNYVEVTGAATTGQAQIASNGSDTNVAIGYSTKGAGQHFFYSNGGVQFNMGNAAASVNYLRAVGAATGGSPFLASAGTDTNIDLILTPKGTGLVRFGTFTASVLSPTGYIDVKDAGGTTRRLLVG